MAESHIYEKWKKEPMCKPRVEKVVVNISVGKSGEQLEKASNVLKSITGQTPCKRKAKKTIRDFNIRKGEPIACIVTLRKQKAIEFLKKVLPVVDNKILKRNFDNQGNFAFGIKEHIEIAGVKYDPDIGIFGMDICVSMGHPGYRIEERKRKKAKMGTKHVLTPEESIIFVKDLLGVEIVD